MPRLFVVFLLLLLAKEHQPEKEKGAEAAKPRPRPGKKGAERNDERRKYGRDQRKDNSQSFQGNLPFRSFSSIMKAEMRKHEVFIGISESYSNITSAMLL